MDKKENMINMNLFSLKNFFFTDFFFKINNSLFFEENFHKFFFSSKLFYVIYHSTQFNTLIPNTLFLSIKQFFKARKMEKCLKKNRPFGNLLYSSGMFALTRIRASR